jgi:hypothetical protein
MVSLNDFIGKQVLICVRDYDDVEGILKGTGDGGYFIETDDNVTRFIPEKDNVVYVEINGRFF